MTSADKELEEQLLEAGNRLLDPPSSVEELLPLLDQVESCLSRVEQSPTKAMQNALSPSLKALIAEKLIKHSDVDVKVAVASCISEITRITAPDAPYDDDQMKEVFQLIVSSFENLYDKSSPSYTKRASIVETVAKVRSCVVMLDLECDTLILEMFQHFFKAVREKHPDSVLSSIETIMTLVIEESEDISLDLLSPILASVKKDNEEAQPLARKLGEKVLESCATKLKPYLVQAVSTLGISLDDYSKVLATICQETPGSVEQNDVCTGEQVANENQAMKEEPPEESTKVVKEEARGASPSQEANPIDEKSPKSVMSNGIAQAGEDDSLVDSKSLKKQEDAEHSDQPKSMNISGNEETNNLDTEKADKTKQKPEQTTERKKRTLSSAKLAESSEGPAAANEKESEKLVDSKSPSKEIPSSPRNDHSVQAAGHSENDKEIDVPVLSPKAVEGESEAVAPPPSEIIPDENRSKRSGRTKKKDTSAKGVAEPAEDDSKKVSEDTSDTEAKTTRRSAKRAHVGRSDRKKATVVDSSKKGTGTANETDAKKPSAKKVDESDIDAKKPSAKKVDESDNDAKKPSARKVDESDNDAKKLSAKKVDENNNDAKKLSAKKVDESDNDARKPSAKKVDESDKTGGGSSARQSEDKKRKVRGKAISDTVVAKSAKDEDKEIVSSPKSATRATKDEEHSEETPKTNLKRKRTPAKENATNSKEPKDLVGSRIQVYWPDDQMFYKGVINSYDSKRRKHQVNYDDGDTEVLYLKNEKWEFIEDESDSDGEEGSDQPGPDATPPKKKGKTNTDSIQRGKVDASSSKSGGGGKSSKSKGASMRSGGKSKDGSKADSKSKTSKTVVESDEEPIRKSKDHTPKSGSSKPVDAAPKSSVKSKNTNTTKKSKSKDEEVITPKPATKSKQETPKPGKSKQETSNTASASKGKPPKSGGKSNVNGGGKVKSGAVKAKDSEKENSGDSTEEVEDTKGKSSTSSKVQVSEAKAGKKRRRA